MSLSSVCVKFNPDPSYEQSKSEEQLRQDDGRTAQITVVR